MLKVLSLKLDYKLVDLRGRKKERNPSSQAASFCLVIALKSIQIALFDVDSEIVSVSMFVAQLPQVNKVEQEKKQRSN